MSVKISIDGEAIKQEFDRQNHNSTLEFLEAQRIDIHYHCRDGFCGACRIKLNKGKICYPKGEPLAFVHEGEFLACCSVPDTDIDISIE